MTDLGRAAFEGIADLVLEEPYDAKGSSKLRFSVSIGTSVLTFNTLGMRVK